MTKTVSCCLVLLLRIIAKDTSHAVAAARPFSFRNLLACSGWSLSQNAFSAVTAVSLLHALQETGSEMSLASTGLVLLLPSQQQVRPSMLRVKHKQRWQQRLAMVCHNGWQISPKPSIPSVQVECYERTFSWFRDVLCVCLQAMHVRYIWVNSLLVLWGLAKFCCKDRLLCRQTVLLALLTVWLYDS